jgi:glycosyltransferase involved in cell wall biosynthesis
MTTRPQELLVSIIVCTYNREKLLEKTLLSLVEQDLAGDAYEIVVVDNASSDNTRAVVERIAKSSGKIRYIYESRVGVAIARNTGARMSRGRYITFFDDDNVADVSCVRELLCPFEEILPRPSIVAGRIDLDWEGNERPLWFSDRYDRWVSRYDFGDQPRQLTADDYIVTMNVAFDREDYLTSGGIREDLSRKGRMFITSGDVDLFVRMLSNGMHAYYQPSALAFHFVPKSRQKRSWLMKRIFGEGTTQIVLDLELYRKSWKAAYSRYFHELRSCVGSFGRLAAACWKRSEVRLDCALMTAMHLGRMSALAQIAMHRSEIVTTRE